MRDYQDNMQPWRIQTSLQHLYQYISENELTIVKQTVFCMLRDRNDPEYQITMIALCLKLQMINYLHFAHGNRNQKLTPYQYDRRIFDGLLETRQQFTEWVLSIEQETEKRRDIGLLWKKLKRIRELWCRMIAMPEDRPFLSELIYAFEYVMSHDFLLPPKYGQSSLWIAPLNYTDYEPHLFLWAAYPYAEIGGPEDPPGKEPENGT